jgi:hypothetical protein
MRKILCYEKYTCEKLNPIKNLLFTLCIFEEVVAFEVIIVICENNCIFEGKGGRCDGMIEEYFVGWFSKEEVEMNIVLGREMLIYYLC